MNHEPVSGHHSRLSFGRLLAASLLAVALVSVGLPGVARGHSAVNSAHSVAFGADGSQLLTVSFGVIHRAPGKAPVWLCPKAFGATKAALNRAVVAHEGAYFLLSDGGVLRSATGSCPWQPTVLPTGTAQQLTRADGGLWVLLEDAGASVLARYEAAKWSTVELPKGAVVGGIHAGPGAKRIWATGYLGKAGTFWRSEDAGKTWHTSKLPVAEFEETVFSPLAAHPTQPQHLLVRAASALKVDRLLRSKDGGDTWQVALAPNPGIDLSSAVWLPSATTGTLFVGSASAGMWRDDGKGLQKMIGAPRIGCLAQYKGRVYTCTDEFAWGAAMLGSDDAGETWVPNFCFAEITGAAGCTPSCAAGWADVVAEHGIQSGKACGGGTATWMDGFSGIDAGGELDSQQTGVDAAQAVNGGSGGGAVTAKAKDSGCHAAGSSSSPLAPPTLLLLACVSLAVLRRRTSAQGSR